MPTIDNWRALREALDSGLTARELASAGHAGSLGRLLAERDRLAAELEALRADAGRWRHVRSNPEWLGWDYDFRPDEVDREVDAAMKGTP